MVLLQRRLGTRSRNQGGIALVKVTEETVVTEGVMEEIAVTEGVIPRPTVFLTRVHLRDRPIHLAVQGPQTTHHLLTTPARGRWWMAA